VLAVLALLAGTAIALLSNGSAETVVREAAERVAADLVFVQADALAGGAARTVVFAVDEDGYRAYATDDGTLLTYPVSKGPFEVLLAQRFPGARVDLVSADFGGSETLSFDARGAPLAGGIVVVTAGRKRYQVAVADGTGRITVGPVLSPSPSEPVVE